MPVRLDARECKICRDRSGNLHFFRRIDKCLLTCRLALQLGLGPEALQRLPSEWEHVLRAFELRFAKAFYLPTQRAYDPILADDQLLVDGLVALCQEMRLRLSATSDATAIPAELLGHILKTKLGVEPNEEDLRAAFGELVSSNPGTPDRLRKVIADCVSHSPYPRKSWFSPA